MQDAKRSELVSAPDWTPWGQPRRGVGGLETAFHHSLVLLREAGGAARAARTSEIFVGAGAGIEWSPMPWALRGRRPGRLTNSMTEAPVILGAGDRLFTTINGVCEQFFEEGRISAQSVRRWVEALDARLAFCEARGIVFRHLVVPDGHAIYADAIPGAPRLSENRPLKRVLAAASPKLRDVIVYPLDALVDGRLQHETSFPHDIHCTGWGAFLVYRALVESLPAIDPASMVKPDDLRVRTFLHAGDVARAAGLPARRVTMHNAPPVPQKALVAGTTYKVYQVDVMVGEDAALPRLVMFRTSNSSQQFPYLMRHFSRITAVGSNEAFFDLIESERPDVVISEMPERYFARSHRSDTWEQGTPPTDLFNAFEAHTGHSLPLPEAT